MTFIFYDTETTGLRPAFDQILQFAAIVTDDRFSILEEIDLRCRLQPHVLPSPGAMLITRIGPKTIQGAPLSCYEMTCAIRTFIQKWSPAVLIGFNSVSYDENMLRQAFYQHLHPVFLTNTNGNCRMDAMLFAQAVAAYRPDAIAVRNNEKGRPSFKLGSLIEANGLRLDNAHDAHADTRATLALVKFLKDGAPEVWDSLYACRSKALATSFVSREDPVLFTDRAFGKPTILAGRICVSPDNPAVCAMFDLACDPMPYLEFNVDQARVLLKSSPRPVRILKTNNLPIVHPYRSDLNVGVDIETAKERLARIRRHPTFAPVIAQALTGQYEDREPSPHIEEQIYGGFPSHADKTRMERFHAAPWADRYSVALDFEEERYRQFAERLIHAEFPEGLPDDRRAALDQWRQSRLSATADVPWMTAAKARLEIESIRSEAAPDANDLLREMSDYYG